MIPSDLPLFDGRAYFYPQQPSIKFSEEQAIRDLEAMGFPAEQAALVCESSRGMYRIRQFMYE